MRSEVNIIIPAGALREMTPAQLESLQRSVLSEGQWEQVRDPVYISGTDYLGVQIPTPGYERPFFLGIEKDGYAHS